MAAECTSDQAELLSQGLNVQMSNEFNDSSKTGKLTLGDPNKRSSEASEEFPADGIPNISPEFVDPNFVNELKNSAVPSGRIKTNRKNEKTLTRNATFRTLKRSDGGKVETRTKIKKNENKYPGKIGKEYSLALKYFRECFRVQKLHDNAPTTDLKAKFLKLYIDVQDQHYIHFTNFYRLKRECETERLKELQSKTS